MGSHQLRVPLVIQIVAVQKVLWRVVGSICSQTQGILAGILLLCKLEAHLGNVGQLVEDPLLGPLCSQQAQELEQQAHGRQAAACTGTEVERPADAVCLHSQMPLDAMCIMAAVKNIVCHFLATIKL